MYPSLQISTISLLILSWSMTNDDASASIITGGKKIDIRANLSACKDVALQSLVLTCVYTESAACPPISPKLCVLWSWSKS
jgi:hypothetical protein